MRFEDGIVDHVAVARALDGDPSVWPRLRREERREVYRTMLARREAELDEYWSWRPAFRGLASSGMVPEDKQDYQDWLVKIADAKGIQPHRLVDRAKACLRRGGVL